MKGTIMQIIVEPLSEADLPQVVDLWKRTEHLGLTGADGTDALRRFLRRNEGLSVVARVAADDRPPQERSTIVGAVLVGHDGRRGYLYHLAVDPAARRRGVAARMVAEARRALSTEGIERCHIMVYAENRVGRAIWRRLGWRDRDDISIMTVDIPAP
ncbi:MAG: GNAT family N-acetyltransferase [Spirochaetales bacterium]|nr:GNAT family N-acetyltransferase [Spirochaetales bacterium]